MERLFHFVTMVSKNAAHLLCSVAIYGGCQDTTTLHLAHPFYELISKFQASEIFYLVESGIVLTVF